MSFKKILLISSIIGIVVGGGVAWLGQSMREVPILHTDTELVNCIEERFENGEFEQYYTYAKLYEEHASWISDSLEILEAEEYRLVNERLTIVDVVIVKFRNKAVEVSDHESDRILEIINAYEAEQAIAREKLNQFYWHFINMGEMLNL
jgi:hypothetical protein